MSELSVLTGVITGVAAYLFGSISSAVIISELLYKDDVRTHASGNAGATNVCRNYGLAAGLGTLFADFLKTALAMFLGMSLAGVWGELIAFVMCFVGHCWPVFFRFRGGKGVSVCFCAVLMFDWRLFAIIAAVFLAVVLCCRIVSVSSMSAMLALLPAAVALGYGRTPIMIASVFAFLSVVYAHRSNIKRLLNGTESKFSLHKKK